MRSVSLTILFALISFCLFSQKNGTKIEFDSKKDSSGYFYSEGVKFFNFKEYKTADSLFSISIKQRPHVDSYFNRAMCRGKMGDQKGFCEDLKEASVLGDREAVALFCKSCGKISDTTHYANDHSKSDKKHSYYYRVNFTSSIVDPFTVNILSETNSKRINDTSAQMISRYYKWYYGTDKKGIYRHTEAPPSFQGGDSALKVYIKKNLIIPERVKNKKLKGEVHFLFIINENGTMSDIELKNGMNDCIQCGEEALGLVKSMPAWIPGKNKGQAVKCYKTLTINFE